MKEQDNSLFFVKPLPFYLRRSSYIHIALFLSTLIGTRIVFEQSEKLREKNMELVQASVRVDMVEMPKYTLKELQNLSSGVEEAKKEALAPKVTSAAKVEEVKPVEKEVQKEKADDIQSFEEANKLKRQNFLSKLKQIGNKKIDTNGEKKVDVGLHGEKSTDLKKLVLAGNKLSTGSAMYGDGNPNELTAFQVYAGRLPDLVRPHWRLPSFLIDKKLKCRIRVWVAKNGEVNRAEVYQSSNDNEYDQRAIEAIKAASPFPSLSEEFGKRGQNGDIVLGFPL